ncbi:hypothetical protein [Onishia taeanensis]
MFEDELLHSYIARKHIMYRHKNVRNIITYPGGWRATPYIPSEIAKKIPRSADLKIAKSLVDLGIIKREEYNNPVSNNFFSALYYLYNSANDSYTPEQKRKNSITNINDTIVYCRECILASIKKNGVGYFKTSWTLHRNCEKHENSFYISNSQSLSLQGIRSILSGEKNPSHSLLTENYEKKTLYKEVISNTNNPPIAPCLADEIQQFAKNNYNVFCKNPSSPFAVEKKNGDIVYDCPKWHRHGCYFSEDDAIHDITKIIISGRRNAFRDLWTSIAKEVVICPVFEPRETKFNSTIIYKSKNKKCTDCWRYNKSPIGCTLAKHPHHIKQ